MSDLGAERPPLVSVVIPTAGGRSAFLEEAVASVLDQSVDDLEVVVVDDSGHGAVSDAWPDRVRVVRRPVNGGIAAARNTGMDAARGRFLALLDDDDRYLPDRVERCLPLLAEADFVLCRLVDSNGRPGPNRRLDGDIADRILDDFTPQPGTVIGRRERFARFDESLWVMEDVEWWLRLARAGTFRTEDFDGYWYRIHPDPRTGYGTAERMHWREEVLRRHATWFESHPRARAFQYLRLGVQARELGQAAAARRYLRTSLRLRPSLPAFRQLLEVTARR